MAERAAPLNHSVRIVDDNGYPTPEFIRWWQEQTLGTPTTATDLSDYLDLISSTANAILVRGATGWTSSIAPGDATKFLNGAAPPAWAAVKDTDLSLSDETTQNATSARHGFLKKLNNDTSMFMRGDGSWAKAAGADLSLTDVTTNNATTGRHGFLPKLDGTTTNFLRGDGSWAAPSGGGGGGWTVLNTFDLSTTTLDSGNEAVVTGIDSYTLIRVVLIDPTVGTADTVALQFSTDGGTSWKTGASDYYESYFNYTTHVEYTANDKIWLTRGDGTTGVGASATIFQPGASGQKTLVEYKGQMGSRVRTGTAIRSTAETDNAVRFLSAKGYAFTGGTLVVMGQ